MNDKVSEKKLDLLREEMVAKAERGEMSRKRCVHTLEVEKMVRRLAEIYLPDKTLELSAAALLHDVTKELSYDEQISLAERLGISLAEEDRYAPKTLHAMTAAALIPSEYPAFATEEIIGYVRWHTTGRAGMTLGEKLVYLADYIDMSRTFEDCVALREYFFGVDLEKMTEEEREAHLDRTLLRSFDLTIMGLLEKQTIISEQTIAARNETALRLAKRS